MKFALGLSLVIALASALPAAFAEPTYAAADTASAPPISGYGYLTGTSDNLGAYILDYDALTKFDDRFKHLTYWIRVSRLDKPGDRKSAYPTEYLLFKIDCPSQTYVLAARFDVDRAGKDTGPMPHELKNPVRKKLPGSKSGPHINFYNSPPELVAPAQLQPACFPGD